jgi:hypothetical protein
MATLHFIGGAPAVAQVHTASIDSVDGTPADNTFTVTIGGEAISVVGDTDVATTATALRAALNASTHPYFIGITWSGTSGDIIGTADVAGCPFVAALTETGTGSGSVTDFAETTANAGPNSFGTAANFSSGTKPAASDVLIIKDTSVPIAFDLEDRAAITVATFRHDKSATGKVGLLSMQFATEPDGTTDDSASAYSGASPAPSAVPEYRPRYLKIGWDRAELGQHLGPGRPAGAPRLKLHNAKSGASDTIVYNTHASGEGQRPALMLLFGHASADLHVRRCPGTIGIAADEPGETATMGDINVLTDNNNDKIVVERGVTYANITQDGGTVEVVSAQDATSATVNGGTHVDNGEHAVTTVTANGGRTESNNVPSSGSAVTTVNVNEGATLDLQASDDARTFATVNWNGGTILDNDAVTMTTFNRPSRKSTLDAEISA